MRHNFWDWHGLPLFFVFCFCVLKEKSFKRRGEEKLGNTITKYYHMWPSTPTVKAGAVHSAQQRTGRRGTEGEQCGLSGRTIWRCNIPLWRVASASWSRTAETESVHERWLKQSCTPCTRAYTCRHLCTRLRAWSIMRSFPFGRRTSSSWRTRNQVRLSVTMSLTFAKHWRLSMH